MLFSPQLIVPARRAAVVATGNTWNQFDKDAGTTLSPDFLTASGTADARSAVRATAAMSGKKFWKVHVNTINSIAFAQIGVMDALAALNGAIGDSTHGVASQQNDGQIILNGVAIGAGDPWTAGDDLYFAPDIPNNLWWSKVNSGNWNDSGASNPATGVGGFDMSGRAGGALYAAFSSGRFGSGGTFDVVTGDFSGSGAPSGFSAP